MASEAELKIKYSMDTETGISSVIDNKRTYTDRRRGPTPIISRYTFFGGQRKTIRRERDKKKYIHVDLYSTRLLIAILSLLMLSCLDAFMTLTLIGKGKVVEANPIMAFFLDYGISPFANVKFAVTAFCLIVLCLFKNMKITRICLPLAIKMYILVVGYEFYLFML